MSWHHVALLLVTITCIGVPMFYVFSIKEKEMHPNVKEIQGIQALRIENAKLRLENAKLREDNDKLRRLVVRMRPICMEGQRCTFADRIYINNTMEELGIEVNA